MYKEINQFTEEEQIEILDICQEENLINTEFDYFTKGVAIQKNRAGEDMKRPFIKTFKKDIVEIKQKFNYKYSFLNEKSGLNFLTFEIQ